MACEDGECEVYIERDKTKYIKELVQYIQEFITYKLKEYA
jgi:genome maintenance exonuclease 1